jgi:hypothetical protein
MLDLHRFFGVLDDMFDAVTRPTLDRGSGSWDNTSPRNLVSLVVGIDL